MDDAIEDAVKAAALELLEENVRPIRAKSSSSAPPPPGKEKTGVLRGRVRVPASTEPIAVVLAEAVVDSPRRQVEVNHVSVERVEGVEPVASVKGLEYFVQLSDQTAATQKGRPEVHCALDAALEGEPAQIKRARIVVRVVAQGALARSVEVPVHLAYRVRTKRPPEGYSHVRNRDHPIFKDTLAAGTSRQIAR